MNYKELNDYELISYIHENNEEANDLLFQKYRPLIISIAKSFYSKSGNSGLEMNDLIQEGMIAFSYAINSYNQDKEAMFYTYARTCVERKMISTMIGTRRLKNKILNESLSYENIEEDYNFENVLKDNTVNPENMVLSHEIETEMIDKVRSKLTDLEIQVFELKMAGFNYKEIANMLDKDPKVVDNTLQRIKSKIKGIWTSK